MNGVSIEAGLPPDFFLLKEAGFADPDDANRPTRLCICFSDVHFTDGTVGNQGADAVVWEKVFAAIADLCVGYEAGELHLILVGDVADMIRTGRWAEKAVYPWQRDHPEFKPILRKIMEGIIQQHAQAGHGMCSFFHLLQQLPGRLKDCYERQGKPGLSTKVRTVVILGNHDKELAADSEVLEMFYRDCLGQPVESLSEGYRRWVGQMYFGDADKYLDPKAVPRLPFYWGDRGFRLFVTHGQWRDKDNSRSVQGATPETSWQVKDGWQLKRWQNIDFKPFIDPCFGDTVAAGVLSGFIARAKEKLGKLPKGSPEKEAELARLKQVLDELDLYRPTAAAIKRIIVETWRLRRGAPELAPAREIIEDELLDSVHTWLDWPFTLESAAPAMGWLLRIAKPIVWVMKFLGAQLRIGVIYVLMWLIAWLQQWQSNAPSFDDMQAFPGFLEPYRNYGFRIHGEGHTHIPLQAEVSFKRPESNKNYTYVNFGTWRDQVLPKQKTGYRRRGVGRLLVVLDKAGNNPGERDFAYWVQDVLTWRDKMDKLG